MSADPTATSSSPRKTRWHVPTPAKYLFLILLTQAFLIASAWQQWFEFNREKGYSVVITCAVTGLMLLLLAAWLVVGRFFKAKAQFSLATLMLMVPVMAIPCAWFAREYQQAQEQRQLVAEATAQGYEVSYDKRLPGGIFPYLSSSDVPGLLVAILGEDFFAEPDYVSRFEKVDDEHLAVIERFVTVKDLTLFDANVTDAGLAHLAGLIRLESLTIRDSFDPESGRIPCLTDGGLAHLKNLRSLQTLELGWTSITDAGLESLIECNQLTEIAFEKSQITDDGLAKLANRYQLNALELPESHVTDAGMKSLRSQTQLERLDLSDTAVTDTGLEALSGLGQLNFIVLNRTKITDAGLKHLKGHAHLAWLDLGRTKVTDAGMAELAGLAQLEDLYLDQTSVTDAGLAYLKDCTELASLHLDRTKITDAGIANLQSLQKLRHVDICYTAVTDVGLERLEALPKLEEVFIFRSKITEAGVRRFQKVCPQCEIIGYLPE